MTKKFSKLLLCMALALTACQSGSDEPAIGKTDDGTEKATVSFGLSRADAEDFAAAGINEITVFVYKVERKGTSLLLSKTMPVADGKFDLEFPLGETFQSIAIANASEVSGTEALENLTLTIDPTAKCDVWVSGVSRFASDKSVTDVSLTLSRKVAQVSFRPAETAEELAAIADYDNLNLTFRNIATSYKVLSGNVEASEITLAAPAANGYTASFYTFDTNALSDNGKMVIEYTKGGSHVAYTQELDCNTKYRPSTRYSLIVPITDPSLLAAPGRAARENAVSVLTSEL